jgi:hypothetical protein
VFFSPGMTGKETVVPAGNFGTSRWRRLTVPFVSDRETDIAVATPGNLRFLIVNRRQWMATSPTTELMAALVR